MSTSTRDQQNIIRFPGETEEYRRARDELLEAEIALRRQTEAVAAQLQRLPLDGIDGELPHITQRINFAVATKAPIERFRAHAHTRGWRHARLLSSANTTYNRDYRAEASDADQRPMATVFVRRYGTIHHFWSSELLMAPLEPGEGPRHVDYMWLLWAILDRTPGGRGDDWMPRLEYR